MVPSLNDTKSIEKSEYDANKLARQASIQVSESKLIKFPDRKDAFCARRFDRDAAGIPIPYVSAKTLLNCPETEASYERIAHAIEEHCANPGKDVPALWERMVFNILINNVDDHWKNIGFIRLPGKRGWSLAPAFDLTPMPDKASVFKMPITSAHRGVVDLTVLSTFLD